MTMKRNFNWGRKALPLFALSGLILVSGCDKTREVLGLNRHQAHEFETMDRRPLEVPPGYDLRPPMPGQKSDRIKDGSQMAKSALGVEDNMKVIDHPDAQPFKSEGERGFLKAAKTEDRDDQVRQKLLDEKDGQEDLAPGEKLFSLKPKKPKGGKIIDPRKEQEKFENSANTPSAPGVDDVLDPADNAPDASTQDQE